MTKRDYMNLSKERLAELLEEKDKLLEQYKTLPNHTHVTWSPPCFEGGFCTNPQRDCINCPFPSNGGYVYISNTSDVLY